MVKGVLYFTAGTRRAVVAARCRDRRDAVDAQHQRRQARRIGAASAVRAAASPTGPTAARTASSTSRPATRWSRSTRRPALRSQSFGKDGIVDLKRERRPADGSGHRRSRPALRAARRQRRHRRRRRAPGRRRAEEQDATRRATSAGSTRAPASGSGSSTRFRGPANSATTRGRSDSWSYTGNAGSWAQMSADPELGLVYLPVELPTGDYYGGHRPGDGLFGESLVALDVKTGKRKWHYQLVHHGIWDMDIPCAPILADLNVNGTADQGDRAADQAGLGVRVRSRDRPAGVADRRAPGREGRRARRVVFADAAVRHQAAGVRTSGRRRKPT